MLILKFLFSVLDDSDTATLFKLKDKFLPAKDQQYLIFVQDFYAVNSKLPDKSTFEQKFNVKLIKNNEPASYWFKEIYTSYQNSIIEKAVIDSAKNKGGAISIFQKAIIDFNTDLEVEVHSYKDGSKRLKGYAERKKNKGITYLSTGMPELDMMSLGYKKADLWTLAGSEGMGKTWQLLKMADAVDNWMIRNNVVRPVLIISGEMSAEELEERLDAIRCSISYQRLSNGTLKITEEKIYERYLKGAESNIIIIDSFDGVDDIDFFISLYRPACIFIDGSHLLAKSYDWKDIYDVTKRMKTTTRNNKIPIINTTHLKSGEGNSAKGGSIDSLAYGKGYTRDSDIVGIMYASDLMILDNQVGIDWVKVRRGNKSRTVWQSDYERTTTTLVENLTGKDLASARIDADDNALPATGKGTYQKKSVQIY